MHVHPLVLLEPCVGGGEPDLGEPGQVLVLARLVRELGHGRRRLAVADNQTIDLDATLGVVVGSRAAVLRIQRGCGEVVDWVERFLPAGLERMSCVRSCCEPRLRLDEMRTQVLLVLYPLCTSLRIAPSRASKRVRYEAEQMEEELQLT